MSRGTFRFHRWLRMIAALSAFVLPLWANDAPVLAGSYHIVQHSQGDRDSHVRLQFHLTNRGTRDLHLRRITLWDFSHPAKGGTQSCSVILRAGSSATITQAFTVPRAEYGLWKHGTRPRIVLEFDSPNGRTTQVVHLDRASSAKVNGL